MLVFILKRTLLAILVALATVQLVGGSLKVVILVLGLLLWDRFAVVIRSSTMQIRAMDYVKSTQAVGCSLLSILFREVLPNVFNQLVVIALVMKPEVVICDEPTSSLDVSVQSQILNLLLDFRKELGLTYMLISHNLAGVEHMATRVAAMYLGRIVEEGETDQIFRNPRHPYTRALLASVMVPQPGRKIPDTQLGAAFPNPLELPPGCTFHPRCSQEPPHPITMEGGYVEGHLYGGTPNPVR